MEHFSELLEHDSLFMGKVSDFQISRVVFESLLCYLSLKFTEDCSITKDMFPDNDLEMLQNYSNLDPPYQFRSEFGTMGSPSIPALRIFFDLYKACIKIPSFRADGLGNVWVIKASQSSRGRNIFLLEDLENIRQYDNGTRLIQKYIENVWICQQGRFSEKVLSAHPFLWKIMNRKFDLRMWVLVTSFSPLEAYVYRQGYLRVSQSAYQLHNINNQKTHLTNFSVNWKQEVASYEDSYVLFSDFVNFLEDQQLCSGELLRSQI